MHYIPEVTGVESIEEETEDNGKEGVVEQTESEKRTRVMKNVWLLLAFLFLIEYFC